MTPGGPLGALMLEHAPAIHDRARELLARPADDRDHAVVVGAEGDLRALLRLSVTHDASPVCVIPRADVVALIQARGLRGTVRRLGEPAPEGAVAVVLVGGAEVAGGPAPLAHLRLLADAHRLRARARAEEGPVHPLAPGGRRRAAN